MKGFIPVTRPFLADPQHQREGGWVCSVSRDTSTKTQSDPPEPRGPESPGPAPRRGILELTMLRTNEKGTSEFEQVI